MKNTIKALFENFPIAMLFYRNIRDLLDQRRPIYMTQWGFKFSGHDEMANGIFEPDETKVVRSLMSDVDMLINVGANVGYYCCHSLSMGKPVIAVEPNARNLYYLLRNIQINGWSKLAEVFPVALGSESNILKMWGTGTGASLVKGWSAIPESYVAQVPILSLDRIVGNTLSGKKALILVDVEGAEYMMLKGSENTLISTPRPIWLMEIASTEHQPAGIAMNPHISKTFEMFFLRGYRAYTADEARHEITAETIGKVMAGEQKLGTHNFIFKH